jgi:hypothetical protein
MKTTLAAGICIIEFIFLSTLIFASLKDTSDLYDRGVFGISFSLSLATFLILISL